MLVIILPLLLSGFLAAGSSPAAKDVKSGLLTRTVKVGGESYTYQVFVPASLAGKKDVPVILFLHGIGQRGEGGFLPADGAAGGRVRPYPSEVPPLAAPPPWPGGGYT